MKTDSHSAGKILTGTFLGTPMGTLLGTLSETERIEILIEPLILIGIETGILTERIGILIGNTNRSQ